MNSGAVKVIFIIALFAEAMIFGTLPMWCKQLNQNIRLLSWLNAMAGGIFLAIALLHMMPETIKHFFESQAAHAEEEGEEEEHAFLLPFLYFVLGYCLVLMADKVLFGQSADCCDETVKQLSVDLKNSIAALPEPSDTEDTCNCDKNQIELIKTQMAKLTVAVAKASEQPIELKEVEEKAEEKTQAQAAAVVLEQDSGFDSMTPFVLLVGLGLHSIFEGIALGLKAEAHDATVFGVAIVLHKGAAAFSLGISYVTSFPANHQDLSWKLMLIFALATPVGILLGMLIQRSNESVELLFNSLSAGTFLYVACSEVIIKEFAKAEGRGMMMLFFLLGIAVIAVMEISTGHSHEHR